MAAPRVAGACRAAILALGVALGLTACGGSSSNQQVSTPTPMTRCNVTLTTSTPLMGAAGGTGTVNVSVNRDCPWTAQSSADWLWFTSAASGQGDATITFAVAPNNVVAQRQAVVSVNDGRLDIRQAAAFCTYAIGSSGRNFPASGGVDRIVVDARDGCVWIGQTNVSWVVFDTTASQIGQGSIGVTVSPNTGPSRSATVFVAGLPWVVTQEAGTGATAPAGAAPVARAPAPTPTPTTVPAPSPTADRSPSTTSESTPTPTPTPMAAFAVDERPPALARNLHVWRRQ